MQFDKIISRQTSGAGVGGEETTSVELGNRK